MIVDLGVCMCVKIHVHVYNVTSCGRDLPQVVLADLFSNSIIVKPLVALCSPSYSTVSALSNYLLFWGIILYRLGYFNRDKVGIHSVIFTWEPLVVHGVQCSIEV